MNENSKLFGKMEKTEINKKNLESELRRLEEITVVLSPAEYYLSKVPLAGRVYLERLERKYQELFPECEKFIFK